MKQVYPFGSELQKVEQADKSPKKVFVLVVYTSAFQWITSDFKTNILAKYYKRV